MAANHVAKWDGATWHPLGSGVSGGVVTAVHALAAFDDDGGSALYVGGTFDTAGGVPAGLIAKWDGANWSPLGPGLSGIGLLSRVEDLAVFDDRAGRVPALYAGGFFQSAGSLAVNGIARWDGAQWSALGSGVPAPVLASFGGSASDGPGLYVGGAFAHAGGLSSARIAKWRACPSIASVPGCFGNPASLGALVAAAQLGQPLPLAFQGSVFPVSVGWLYAGFEAPDAAGCGVLLPGLGELLLGLAPAPLLLEQQATPAGASLFVVAVPSDPSLLGLQLLLQVLHGGLDPSPVFEFSTGLRIRFVP